MVCTAVRTSVCDAVGTNVRAAVGTKVCTAVGSKVCAAVGTTAVCAAIGTNVCTAVGTSACAAVGTMVCTAVGTKVGTAVSVVPTMSPAVPDTKCCKDRQGIAVHTASTRPIRQYHIDHSRSTPAVFQNTLAQIAGYQVWSRTSQQVLSMSEDMSMSSCLCLGKSVCLDLCPLGEKNPHIWVETPSFNICWWCCLLGYVIVYFHSFCCIC